MTEHHTLSLWLDGLAGSLEPRPALAGDADVDVAIVGGGFTGLWTAYYLTRIDPGLRIMVIEREICGFGASGRNGGWCVGELAATVDTYTRRAGLDAAVRLARAVFDAVDEVGRVARAEGIECGYAKGGTVRLARNAPQAHRQREEVRLDHELGFTSDEIRLLSADEARALVGATEVRGGIHFAPSAALDPGRLVRGLADVVQRRGVAVVEQTSALSIEPGRVLTDRGTVRAEIVVRATEAYTRDLAGERRSLIPVYSLMIATEPLGPQVWEEIGLLDRPTFADDRYMVIYGQRTSDDRIAFGGRGVPYLFGSRIDPAIERRSSSHHLIRQTLVELFPVLASAEITHRWGGVLAIPRDWTPGVCFDRAAGLAVAGGYVGEGVAASNLAGRTLAELVTARVTERTGLPWVGARSRRWEPEPLRWLGVRASRRIMAGADDIEFRTQTEARRSIWLAQLLRRGRDVRHR
ncbi:MAG: NAD(P)/FAD-dependent oxidoreductase [Acidimicrobiales bacterium]